MKEAVTQYVDISAGPNLLGFATQDQGDATELLHAGIELWSSEIKVSSPLIQTSSEYHTITLKAAQVSNMTLSYITRFALVHRPCGVLETSSGRSQKLLIICPSVLT